MVKTWEKETTGELNYPQPQVTWRVCWIIQHKLWSTKIT